MVNSTICLDTPDVYGTSQIMNCLKLSVPVPGLVTPTLVAVKSIRPVDWLYVDARPLMYPPDGPIFCAGIVTEPEKFKYVSDPVEVDVPEYVPPDVDIVKLTLATTASVC